MKSLFFSLWVWFVWKIDWRILWHVFITVSAFLVLNNNATLSFTIFKSFWSNIGKWSITFFPLDELPQSQGCWCCLFWPVFGCCILQMLVKICFFNFVVQKCWKRKKSKKIDAKFCKKMFFWVCTRILI